jgi:putative hydrolase of HD superfamily
MEKEEFKSPVDLMLDSANERLTKQLKFTIEIDKMTQVLRRTLLTDKSRRENDAEHSWHIGVMAMLLSEYAVEKPNVERAVEMCLIHDLIEIYAGDTFAFDKEGNKDKAQREELAADKLYALLPEDQGKHFRAMWEEFDAMQTVDSKFAACMDRLQPFLHNTLTTGHTWIQACATVEDVHNRMAPIQNFMPEIWSWLEKNIEHGVEVGWIKK